jgi:hypothetical protein
VSRWIMKTFRFLLLKALEDVKYMEELSTSLAYSGTSDGSSAVASVRWTVWQ